MGIETWLTSPWPWWLAGPLVGAVVPLLLWIGNKAFGVSSSLRHACAILPGGPAYFRYAWRDVGGWNLLFALGIVLGGAVAALGQAPLTVASATRDALAAYGVTPDGGLAPAALASAEALRRPAVWAFLLAGGFLVGFGARWAGGCTSGHAITGLATRQLPSLLAVIGFFAGGLVGTHLLLPVLLPALTGGGAA